MEYKHFSHTHGLIVHQVPSESQITCSGCKFPGTGSVYACWACSFFLHEQCFQATRSLNHPSHTTHPLTLVPYPTYPSNSFFCNSCNLVGTGLSYSCSNCEFDIHVHCAFRPNSTTTDQSNPPNITINYPIHHEHVSQNNPIPIYPPPCNYGATTLVPQMSGLVPNQYETVQSQYVPYTTGNEPIHVNGHVPNHPSSQYGAVPNFSPYMSTSGTTAVVPVADKPQGYPCAEHTSTKNQITHFSHKHPLRLSEFQEGDGIVCSGCEEHLVGLGYSCIASKCDYNLHKSCFELPRELKHESHPEHILMLLPSSPYQSGKFSCSACLDVSSSFVYHCKTCEFDLHVNCASLPKIVKRNDHDHPLFLLYSSPYKKLEKGQEVMFSCDVCHKIADEMSWVYYCKKCDFGTHLECVNKSQISSHEQTLANLLANREKLEVMRLEALMAKEHREFILALI